SFSSRSSSSLSFVQDFSCARSLYALWVVLLSAAVAAIGAASAAATAPIARLMLAGVNLNFMVKRPRIEKLRTSGTTVRAAHRAIQSVVRGQAFILIRGQVARYRRNG